MTIKIFLGNLSSDTSSDQLRPLFEKYGEVVECDVLKNFGFVHMVNKNEANKAIAQLDGYSVDGNNIRVELSTGKGRGNGGGGKFDRKGFGGGRPRPYGPPGRGDPRDFYPPPPPPMYDRYDPYYRYYMEREAFYARAGDRDRYPMPPRDRFPDPRDRVPPRPYDDRARGMPADPYFREREAIAARPPPEYYDRKPMVGAGARAGESVGAAGGAGGFNGMSNGSDFYRRPGANLGGAAGGAGDYNRQNGFGQQGGYGAMGRGMGGNSDSQSTFATDPIFF